MRRVGQPQQTTPVKVLGELNERMRKQEFRIGRFGWRFNRGNEGGWGFVRFNDSFDLDTIPDPPSELAVGGTWGGVIEDDSGEGLLIGSTTEVLVKGEGSAPVTLQAGGGIFPNLPTSPGATGSLWNDSGTVKVS